MKEYDIIRSVFCDLGLCTVAPAVIPAMQYDSAMRYISIALYDDGEPWNVPEGFFVNIRMKKADGNSVYSPAEEIRDNIAVFELSQQMCSVPGRQTFCIEIVKGEEVVQSFLATLENTANPISNTEIESLPEYKTIQMLVEEAKALFPSDGEPGQVLTKTEDGTEWADPQGGGSGTSDYEKLTNKPQINSVELSGNKSLQDLGAQPVGDYAERSEIPTKTSQLQNDIGFLTDETDPTVPEWAKSPEKPSYTPQEIGAQPAGDYALKSEIPTKLPSPNALTFSGAASGSYDGSETVDINIPEVSGIPGKAATIQIGTVTTGEAGTQAIVTNSGNENDAIFNFTIPQGRAGENGKTPVKGVDYYTEADKQEMVQAVIAALPNGDEVSY